MSEDSPDYDIYEGILSGICGLAGVAAGAFTGLKSIFDAAAIGIDRPAGIAMSAVMITIGALSCLCSDDYFKSARNASQALRMIPAPK